MPYHGMGTLSQRGDPGFFGSLFRGLKGAVGGFVKGGPLGALSGAARGLAGGRPGRQVSRMALTQAAPPRFTGLSLGGPGGLRLGIQRPGAAPPIDPVTGLPTKKRKRINPANPKALRRAIRRTSGFVKLARHALKGTGYRVVTSGSRARRDLPAGHAHIR